MSAEEEANVRSLIERALRSRRLPPINHQLINQLQTEHYGFGKPERPLWRASDPLPTEAELFGVDRSWNTLKQSPGFWDVPRGPLEPRVAQYTVDPAVWKTLSKDQKAAELRKMKNSLFHPQGEAMASWKNYLYLNAPTWMGGRPWDVRRALHKYVYDLSRYPSAESWAGDGFRHGRAALAKDIVPPPGGLQDFWVKSSGYRVAALTIGLFGCGVLLNFVLGKALGQKAAPTCTPEWEEATKAKYAKYNPDPVSKHVLGQPIGVVPEIETEPISYE